MTMPIASSSRVTVNMMASASTMASTASRRINHLGASSLARKTQRRSYSANAVTVSLTWLHKTTRFTLPTFSSSSTPTTHPTQLQPAFALQDPSPSTSTAEAAASPSSLLEQLWDGILRAVPKSKVSHSRKAMRSANKGLKDRTDLVHCASCGRPKLAHHICETCYGEVTRLQKAAAKAQGKQQQQDQQQWKQL